MVNGISSGKSSGNFSKNNCIGTFSGVNATGYDEHGVAKEIIYHGKTRKERHDELVQMGIESGLQQAQIAYDIAGNKAPIHMNILWEMGGAERVLHGILEMAKGIIKGVTCGAGMPYKLGEVAQKYQVYYYPIVSSMRAFRALWKRGYSACADLLGGVVYEDPWKAGGHNGLSNSENPLEPQDPYHRVRELRTFMNEVGLQSVPIIMAGGVWNLKEWEHWLNNDEIGKIAFQFGTRPIVTEESEVPMSWKKKLLTLKEGDVFLNNFSPTGFYSSAVANPFLQELRGRSDRQVKYSSAPDEQSGLMHEIEIGARRRRVYLLKDDVAKVIAWRNSGYIEGMRTPDNTLIFVTPEVARTIQSDQIDCMGCLSACKFSNWRDREDFTTGHKPDPRSFCIQKTLQDIVRTGDVENQLMFSGHNAYRFATDELYANGFIPTIKELVERIKLGD